MVEAQRVFGPEQTGNKNLVYWLYLAGPLAWYGVSGVRELGYAAGSDTVLTAFFLSGSLAILLAPWLPTRYGPVVISAQELFYFVEGPFGLRGTALRRTVRICLGVAGCAGLVSAVIAVGLRMEVVDALLMAGFGMGTAAPFASGIVLGGSGVATWARLAFTGLGCGILGLALGMNLDLWLPRALTGAVLVCAAAMMLSLPAALDQVTDARLRTDLRSRELLTAGLVAGDLRVAAWTGGTARRFFRGSRLALGSHSWLNDYSESVSADRILPQGVWGMAARHLTLPVLLSALSLALGFGAGNWLFLGTTVVPAAVLILFLLPPLIKLSLSGTGALPAEMMTGVITPMGDLSAIARTVWMFQWLIPAVLLAVLLQYMSLTTAAWWFVGVLLLLTLFRLKQLSDIERLG